MNWVNDYLYYLMSLPLLSYMELVAVISALLYVIFAAKQSILCWPAALVSTVLYTAIFYDVYLWMDSILQIYYFAMALYGWYCWQGRNQADNEQALHISRWSWQKHIIAIASLTLLSLVLGHYMATETITHFPYIDAATTVFAVFATYLVTQKVLENWLYWIAIDAVSIYLYIEKSLFPTAFLFALYVVLAFVGFIAWQRAYKGQHFEQQWSNAN